jgi:hypothetical protein
MRLEINLELPFQAGCSSDEWKMLMLFVGLMDRNNYVLYRPVGYSDATFYKIVRALHERNLIHRVSGTIQVNKMFARVIENGKRKRVRN